MAKHAGSALKIMESSFFLISSSGLTAGLGFLFWIVVDRSYSTERVGLATALINAMALISYLSLLGLNTVLIRFPAPGPARNSQVTRSLLFSCAGGLLFGGGFLALLPWLSPRLEFVRADPVYVLLFVGFCALAAVNLLTDSVFMAARLTQYNLLVDGLMQSLSKLGMPLLLVGFGAIGIVASTGAGYAVAVIASLAAMYLRLGFRFDLRTPGTRLREHARYSLGNYGSSLLNVVPQLALPMIALQQLGSEAEAYYFMAFQIANILYTASHSIGDATFSEASHDVSRLPEALRLSARLNLVVLVPAAAVISLAARFVLRLFGAAYAAHARSLLILLCAGAVAVAFNNWSSNALRVAGSVRPIVVGNVVYTASSVGMALTTAGRGLLWLGWAWIVGNLLCGIVAAVCIPSSLASLAPESGPAAEASDGCIMTQPPDRQSLNQRSAVPGMIDETLPLALPWVVRDMGRVGARAAERRQTERSAKQRIAAGTVAANRFGGDMAVRERAPAPSAEDGSQAW